MDSSEIEYNKLNQIIAENIEILLQNEALKTGLTIHSGNYKLNKIVTQECDLVLDEPHNIDFVEIKKKNLTSKAKTGDKFYIDLDLCEAYLSSQEQLFRHELNLRETGELHFKNNTSLVLDSRNINRISIALFDFDSFNEHIYSMNLVKYLNNLVFEFTHAKKGNGQIKSIDDYEVWRKRMETLNSKNSSLRQSIQKLEKEYDINNRSNIFQTYFFPIDFFLYLLSESKKETRETGDLLKDFRNISFCSGDIFLEYRRAEKILKSF